MFKYIFVLIVSIFIVYQIIDIYKMQKKFKNDRLDSELDKLKILFIPIIQAKPYITIRLLEKSYKNKYIKFGVVIPSEGIADALMGDSPLDLLKERLRFYKELESKFTSDSYNIELVLIES
jgi:hypothetical protein